MKDGRSVILARVVVGLPRHQRLLGIRKECRAAALGVWLAATCYSRGEELDGFCPLEAIEAIASEEVLTRLVDVGLFAAASRDGVPGYEVVNYARFNETKADIEARLRLDRKRKKSAHVPKGIPSDSDRNPTGIRSLSVGNPGVGNGVGDGEASDPDLARESSAPRLKVAANPDAIKTPAPDDIPITEAVVTSCVLAGSPRPTREHVVQLIAWARKNNRMSYDWASELVWWVGNSKKFDRPSSRPEEDHSRRPERKLLG